jgi:hypothetical protein
LAEGFIKSTNGAHIHGPFNPNIDLSVVQLNHYKCKTLPEFEYISQRGRADVNHPINVDVKAIFRQYDKNDVEELTACHFYQKKLAGAVEIV